jgi:NADH-quinone oxidoreductase subunit F
VTLVNRVLPQKPFTSWEAYRAQGGGEGLAAALRVAAEVVIAEIEAAGLRGRGGGGFPTGTKWRTVAAHRSPALPTSVVVNAAEGEPATFKDRVLLRSAPYAVVEGALIAAHAVGAEQVVVAVKAADRDDVDRVRSAVAEMSDEGLLRSVGVDIVAGPDEYLFGEETALLEVVNGRPPLPRIAPPFRRGVIEVVDDDAVGSGRGPARPVEMAGPGPETLAPPSLVNNAETLANVPQIVAKGAAWFRSVGTESSPGTILCTVTGEVARPGVAEVALGTPLREAIAEVSGRRVEPPRDAAQEEAAVPPARPVKAVLNGVSGSPLPAEALDTPLTYEDMAAAGSGLGTASLQVVREGADMTAVAAGAARFLAIESCGQCTPCKDDGLRLTGALERLCRNEGDGTDLAAIDRALATVADGARCNLASQQQAVVGQLVHLYRDELEAHAEAVLPAVEPMFVSEIRDMADGDVVLDEARRGKQPDWTHDESWSGTTPVDRLLGQRERQDQI